MARQQTIIKLNQWSYMQRSDGTYVVTGTSDKKVWADVSEVVELYTVISPKDKGDHVEFDLPGTYCVRCFKAQEKKAKKK